MQYEIKLTTEQETTRFYVAFTPDRLILGEEGPLDILLETLTHLPTNWMECDDINRLLKSLKETGRQHERYIVLPEALSFMKIVKAHDIGLPAICIDKIKETVEIPGHEIVNFWDFFMVPFDRNESTDTPRLNTVAPSSAYTKTYFEAASLQVGMLDAVTPGPYNPFDERALLLAGLLAAHTKIPFQEAISGPYQGGSTTMGTVYSDLVKSGLVVSDRGWMPKMSLRSAHFPSCLQEAEPKIREIGYLIGPILAHLDPALCHLATVDVLTRLGENLSQYSVINSSNWPKMSNHQSLKAQQIISTLCQKLEVTLPPRKDAA